MESLLNFQQNPIKIKMESNIEKIKSLVYQRVENNHNIYMDIVFKLENVKLVFEKNKNFNSI